MKDKLPFWKVPCRQVYCNSFRQWLGQTIYCHLVLRLSPIATPKFNDLPMSDFSVKEH